MDRPGGSRDVFTPPLGEPRDEPAGQSFSDVIKEHFSGGITAEHFADVVREAEVAQTTLDAIDDLIDERRAHLAGAPEL